MNCKMFWLYGGLSYKAAKLNFSAVTTSPDLTLLFTYANCETSFCVNLDEFAVFPVPLY